MTLTTTTPAAPPAAVCPLCEHLAVDPLPFEGTTACARCLGTCTVCTGPTIVGEPECGLCIAGIPALTAGRAA